MMNPQDKIKSLQEKALKSSQEARDATKKEKAMQWAEIKKLSPETANFILAVTKKTGKPKRLMIKFEHKIIEINN